MTRHPLIGLLDCNNFFVSCERLFRPDLIGRPVVVLSSNDGCVVARSQEVKDAGIPMGAPHFQIKDTLDELGATVFSSHFALYRDISRRVFSVMREEAAVVEQYSVDEAFFQITDDPRATAARIRAAVERNVGIPVSIGIARTKTQAKYANHLAKKESGLRSIIDTAEWETLAPTIPLSAVWGIGGNLHLRMKQHGLTTVHDLITADPSVVATLFGVVGTRLQKELQGVPVTKISTQPSVAQKSIMNSRSFPKTVEDREILADAIAYHVRHIAAELRDMGYQASSIRVSIHPSRHGTHILYGGSKEASLPTATNDTMTLLRIARDLLADLYEPGVPYKKAGVVVANLRPSNQVQHTLFSEEATSSHSPLLAVIDQLNAKTGKEVVTIGSRLKETVWQPRSAARSPAYTTHWSAVPTVRA